MARPGAALAPPPAPAPAPPAGAAHRSLITCLLVGAVIVIALRLANCASLREAASPDPIGVLTYASLLWFFLSRPGSASRRCAAFALWTLAARLLHEHRRLPLLATALLLDPRTFEAGIWFVYAAGILHGLYILTFC